MLVFTPNCCQILSAFVFPQLAPDVSSAPTTVPDKIITSTPEIPTTAGEGKNNHFTCAFLKKKKTLCSFGDFS